MASDELKRFAFFYFLILPRKFFMSFFSEFRRTSFWFPILLILFVLTIFMEKFFISIIIFLLLILNSMVGQWRMGAWRKWWRSERFINKSSLENDKPIGEKS